MFKHFQHFFWGSCFLTVGLTEAQGQTSEINEKNHPNILWIIMDDIGREFPCFGTKEIQTPNVDKLIKEGTWFPNAFLTAPVSSPSRSAMITGMYQTTIGANNHLSGRGEHRIKLPEPVVPVAKIFQDNGYYTANQDYPFNSSKIGKTDYNFDWDTAIYNSNDWSSRKHGQPFFAQIQLYGGKNRDTKNWRETAKKELGTNVDPAIVKLPPYYPNDSLILTDWAEYLDCIRYADKLVGEIIDRLKKEGLYENTLIILMGDNGVSHARGKQFLYDEGIGTLFVVRGPGIPAGLERMDLIEHIDMPAISLSAAGIPVPNWMQGRDVFSDNYVKRDFVFAARDRCGETIDRIRSVRSKEYKYIRNFFPELPLLQPSNYKDSKPIIKRLRELHQQGKLNEMQEKLLFSPQRPPEELYDIIADPFETNNLAEDPKYANVLEFYREHQKEWSITTKDPLPESYEVYCQEMKFQLKNTETKEGKKNVARNIREMKKWLKQQERKGYNFY